MISKCNRVRFFRHCIVYIGVSVLTAYRLYDSMNEPLPPTHISQWLTIDYSWLDVIMCNYIVINDVAYTTACTTDRVLQRHHGGHYIPIMTTSMTAYIIRTVYVYTTQVTYDSSSVRLENLSTKLNYTNKFNYRTLMRRRNSFPAIFS